MVRWYVQGYTFTFTFYPKGVPPLEHAARTIASRFAVQGVSLWPTEEPGIFRATWFDPAKDCYAEVYLRVYPHNWDVVSHVA